MSRSQKWEDGVPAPAAGTDNEEEKMLILSLSLLIICSYTDIKERGIDLRIIAAFFISVVILFTGVFVSGDKFEILKKSLMYEPEIINILSGLIPGLFLLAVCRITKGAVGMGDVYVVLLLGLMTGFEKTFAVLFLSMVMTALTGLACIAFGSKKKKDSLPYIPFVLGAFVSVMILGRG